MSTTCWDGSAPKHWTRTRIKYACQLVGGGTPSTENLAYWNGEIPWVSPKDMKSFEIVDTEDHLTESGLAAGAAKLVAPGAVLLVMRSGILRHSIPVATNRVSVALNQDIRALIPGSTVEARYLARLIEGHQQQLLNAWSKEGTTVESLESDLVGDTKIAIPTIPQQRAIADYLDRETARLDELVAAKEKLLALLTEKRRALITHAVTRGVDRGVRLRDSGVPWLGQVPAHWDLIALRFLVSVTSGATPDTWRPELWDGEIPWVSPKDMKRDMLEDSEDHVTPQALSVSSLSMIEPDAVLIVVRGMILAHSFPTAITARPVTINQDLKAFRCNDVLEPRFLRDFFRGIEAYVVSLTDASAHGTRKLESEILGRLEVCVPPIAEQRAIVAHIKCEATKLDTLRAAAERTIALLRERRAGLIADAVAGKLEIPEVA